MEAPKKIYIDDSIGEFDDRWSINQNNNSIEYTRTDAFIEEACEYLFENYHGEKLSLRMIENFRRYLKGE